VTAWGNNESGQTNVPPDLTNVIAVAAGYAHSLALRADGTVIAWGSSDIGATNVPADLMNVVAVAAGFWHGLALRDNGTVIAWGIPAEVPPDLTNVVAIAAGSGHSLALRADGTMVAWGGDNRFGECSPPLGLPRVTAVSGGGQHTVVLVDLSQAGAAPTIVGFPRSRTAATGSTAHFSVRAVGFPPMSYQWYFGTNIITGATSALLTLTYVRPDQSGEYTVVVTNPAGSTTSPPATLSVLLTLEVNMVPAITLNGGLGLTYRLEFIDAVGPTNAWEALATLLITNPPQLYFDISAIGQPRRFYRLVELP